MYTLEACADSTMPILERNPLLDQPADPPLKPPPTLLCPGIRQQSREQPRPTSR